MISAVTDRQAALAARFPSWQLMPLHGILDRACADFAMRPYVRTDQGVWSYTDIAKWSKSLAGGLERLGVAAGDRVAMIMANYPEFVALKFAISRLGAIAVPINILNRRDEIAYALTQSKAKVLVTMDRFRGNCYLDALDNLIPGWENAAGSSALSALRHIVVFETGEAASRPETKNFSILGAGEDNRNRAVDPASICDIIYTSGTTGPPKGVMLSHDMLSRTAFGAAYARAFVDEHSILFSLPMYHVFGYVEGMLAVPWVGGSIMPQLRFDAEASLEAIEKYSICDALMIPTMTLALLDAASRKSYDLASLHFMLASGGRAPVRIWDQVRDVLGVREITTGYGMTETTATAVLTLPNDPIVRVKTTNGCLRNVGPAGDLQADGLLVNYKAIDPDSGQVLPPGTTGELVAKGIGVTSGYYDMAEATTAAFTADGWLRTGDLGSIDSEGYLSLQGRLKDSYRCGGEQVMPTEVEDVLTGHPEVSQAHVVPITDERMGEVGVGFVVLHDMATVTPDELHSLVSARLARFKIPKHILIVTAEQIPTTASGRARKFLLSEMAVKMLDPA